MIRTDKRLRVCTCLLVLNLCFIWGNSLLPGEVSGAFSGWARDILAGILPGGTLGTSGGGLLRKLAHFTEFTALGMCLTWMFGMLKKTYFWPFLCGAAAACVDETIQRFVPDRGPSLKDVGIDTCGVLTGMILLLIGYHWIKTRKHTGGNETMKKLVSIVLALTMMMTLAACGNADGKTSASETTAVPVSVEGTMEELLNKVIEQQPVEFAGGVIPVDLTDTSEDGLWAIKNYTGLDSVEQISEAAVYEPMMGSIAFSMVMVRVIPDETGTLNVAEAMKAGIDQRKWICVEADDLLVTSYGDVVMLIMVASDSGMTAQSFVDAFAKVCGGELEYTI